MEKAGSTLTKKSLAGLKWLSKMQCDDCLLGKFQILDYRINSQVFFVTYPFNNIF
jgi:hypothetical protein